MFLLTFYRFYIALLAGAAVFFLILPRLWFAIGIAIAARVAWLLIERLMKKLAINRSFEAHQTNFKELYGPYGIRLINKAESDPSIKQSLAEVFVKDSKKLQENVKTLETMEVLFNAGMRPDGDAWQLHDLKLKYGKYRVEKEGLSGKENEKKDF
jgi:hypothetical protein